MGIARFLRSWVAGNPTIDSSHADPIIDHGTDQIFHGQWVHRVCKIMALEIKKSGRKWGQPLNDLTLTATMLRRFSAQDGDTRYLCSWPNHI